MLRVIRISAIVLIAGFVVGIVAHRLFAQPVGITYGAPEVIVNTSGEGIRISVEVIENGARRKASVDLSKDDYTQILTCKSGDACPYYQTLVKGLYTQALAESRVIQILTSVRAQAVDPTGVDAGVPKPAAIGQVISQVQVQVKPQ